MAKSNRSDEQSGFHFQCMLAVANSLFAFGTYVAALNFVQHFSRSTPEVTAHLISGAFASPFIAAALVGIGNALAIHFGKRLPIALLCLPILISAGYVLSYFIYRAI
jgi:hypothetical protein